MSKNNFYDRRKFLGTAAKTMAAGSLLATGFSNAESVKVKDEKYIGNKSDSGKSVTNHSFGPLKQILRWSSKCWVC